MKLSEAIRLGAMLKPQGFGLSGMFGEATCVLASAADANGIPWAEMFLLYHATLDIESSCPACGSIGSKVAYICAVHLNDAHRWTRERIADWVATIEAQQVVDPETAPVSADKTLAEAKQ